MLLPVHRIVVQAVLFSLIGLSSGEQMSCTVGGSCKLLAEDSNRLAQFYINGDWTDAVSPTARPHNVIDPSTEKIAATITLGGQEDTDAAVDAAEAALETWSSLEALPTRIRLMEKLLQLYSERIEEMAMYISIEMGAPIELARSGQAGSGINHLMNFLERVKAFDFERTVPGIDPDEANTLLLMEPIGVVGLITPWNWPMNQVMLKVVPALLVGCTCVLKPSELAPLSSMLLAEMIDQAGFPPGVFNLVNGDGLGVGTQLSKHPKVAMISFTGSTRAGSLISQNAADTLKRVALELGGKGANILFADVDHFDSMVEDGVEHCFSNSGQSCNAPTRMLIERSVYDRAVQIAIRVAGSFEVKSAHESGDHIGPVANEAQFNKVQSYIQTGMNEGAKVVAGGIGRPDGLDAGYFIKPTIFVGVKSDMKIMQDEIFGPVLCIMPFDTEEEALRIANDTPYGLTHYVYSSDKARRRRLARRLKAGMVEMNGIGQDWGFPFGGVKFSGNGREGGTYGLEEFLVVKSITGWWDEDDE